MNEKDINVLLVLDSMGSGGVQRLAINLIQEFINSKITVTLLLYNQQSEHFLCADLQDKIKIVSRSKDPGFSFTSLSMIIKEFRNQYDCVYSFQPTANIYCAISKILVPKRRLICCEFSLSNPWENKIRRAVANIANNIASGVICNTHAQAAYLRKRIFTGGKVRVAWNGYPKVTRSKEDYRLNKPIKISLIGRIAFPKNGLTFLKAIDLFQKRNDTEVEIRWVGRQDSDNKSRKMFSQMIEYLELNEKLFSSWTWVGELSDVTKIYKTSDLIILPSLYEGLPSVICEAMMAGCPVVCSNISDNHLLLGDKERGLLCDPTDPLSICESIEAFCDLSPVKRKEIAERAIKFAQQQLTIEQMANHYISLLPHVSDIE